MKIASADTATPQQAIVDETEEFLTFVLDGQEYGVDILRVQEIRGWESVTRIPNTPEYVQGVLNLRGSIVPIIDLRQRLGMESREHDRTTVIVVLQVMDENGGRTMGVVVDGVSDVCSLSRNELQDAPEFGGKVDTSFLRGMATRKEELVIILEVDRLLSSSDIDLEGIEAN